MKKLDTIKKNLEKSGITCKYIILCKGSEKVKGLNCNTDYEGPYPTAETFDKIEKIKKESKGYTVEPRGYKTAVLVY